MLDRFGGGSVRRRESNAEKRESEAAAADVVTTVEKTPEQETVAVAQESAATQDREPAEPAARDRSTRADARDAFDALTETIWRLRQPDGCPWDREQTHESIASNMIEEAYEAVDCIEAGDAAHLREELGDVLMQVMLHAQIAADAGAFTIADVVGELNEKLIRRHPHVFGAHAAADDADEVLDIWDRVKRDERAGDGGARPAGLLDSVPKAFPALMQAQKVSKRAAKAGFEWETTDDVWAQVASERAEFEAEEPGSDARELEFGDMLFALVNVARREGIDAERALRRSTAKFRRRWAAIEEATAAAGIAMEDLSTEQLNVMWDAVKKTERELAAEDGADEA